MADKNAQFAGISRTAKTTGGAGLAAVVTVVAPTLLSNTLYVKGFILSASAAPAAAVEATLADGVTPLIPLEIPASAFAPIVVSFGTHPIRITPGSNAVLTLPALGGAAVASAVLLYYIGTV